MRNKMHRQARREGDDNSADRNLSTISPPVLILQNTQLPGQKSVDGKTVGMSRSEMARFCEAQNFHWKDTKAVYKPWGHTGVTLALYEASEEGFLNAKHDDTFFKRTQCGRCEWEKWESARHRHSGVPRDERGRNIIFGYLATEADMIKYDKNCSLVLNWRVRDVAWRIDKEMAESSRDVEGLQLDYEELERKRRRIEEKNRGARERERKVQEADRELKAKYLSECTELEKLRLQIEERERQKTKAFIAFSRDDSLLEGFTLSNKEDFSRLRVQKLRELSERQAEQTMAHLAEMKRLEELALEKLNRKMHLLSEEKDRVVRELEAEKRAALAEMRAKAKQRLEEKKKKIEETERKLKEVQEDNDDANEFLNTMITAERPVKEKKQEAEKALLKALGSCNQVDGLYVREVGNIQSSQGLWRKAQKERDRTVSNKAMEELLKEADKKLRSSKWNIWMKTETDEKGEAKQREINTEDPFLKKVEKLLGREVKATVVNTFKELEEHNASGRYPVTIGIWCRKQKNCELCGSTPDTPAPASYDHVARGIVLLGKKK